MSISDYFLAAMIGLLLVVVLIFLDRLESRP